MRGTDSNDGDRGLSRQETFELLSSHRRRLVLRCLRDRDGVSTIGELSSLVAARENDVDVDGVTRSQRKRVYTALRQSHLPRLDDAGVVEYDADRGDVELTPLADDLWVHLSTDAGSANWPALYLSVLVTVGLGLLAHLVGVPPFGGLSLATWVIALVVGFLSLAAAHMSIVRGANLRAARLRR